MFRGCTKSFSTSRNEMIPTTNFEGVPRRASQAGPPSRGLCPTCWVGLATDRVVWAWRESPTVLVTQDEW